MHYDSRITGDTISCVFTPERALTAPVFCFSGMGPFEALSGGTVTKTLGSYTEIALPNLKANEAYTLEIQ